MEDVVLIGIVMAIVEIAKGGLGKVLTVEAVKQVTPLLVLALAAGLNALSAYLFTPEVTMQAAILTGLKLGATAAGIYGLGKAALGKS
jgi:hypothetical protein